MKIDLDILKKASCSEIHIVLTSAQVKVIGLKYPLEKGWIDRLANKDFSEEVVNRFIANKYIKKKKRKNIDDDTIRDNFAIHDPKERIRIYNSLHNKH